MDYERLSTDTAAQLKQGAGLDYVRALSCLHEGTKPLEEAFPERFPHALSASRFRTKAAVAAGTPSDATFAGPLTVVRPSQTEYVALVRAAALMGRIPGLRRLPFNTSVPVVTTGGTYGWVGAGKPKPVGELDLATVQLTFSKSCGTLVMTEELMRLGSPVAEVLLREELVSGNAGFLDVQMFDPSVTAVANVNPASLTSAAVAIPSSGTSAANALTDWKALRAAFTAANPNAAGTVVLASPRNAEAFAMAFNAPMWSDGGTLFGIRVFESTALGTNVVMLDPSGILVALDDIEIDASKHTSIEMEVPVTDPSTSTTVMRSLWQMNLVALKVTAYANWKLARASAVQYVSGAAYV
jgi:hypothetical protein